MKLFTIAIFVLCTLTVTAQKKPKIKGNKDVVEVYNNLDSFTELEVTDGLKVYLTQTNATSYRLKTDSNLVDVIRFEVFDGKLKISTLNTISSSKKLEIYLTFASLKKITLGNDAKIEGQNTFMLEDAELLCYDGSDFELDIKGNNLKLQMNGNAQGDLKLISKETSMNLNDNAYFKGIVSTETFYLNLNKRSDIKVKGSSNTINLITTGSSDIDARKLKTNSAIINASDSSKIRVYASNDLNIFAKGKSNIYVYGNPEIKVEGLNDKSQIIKK
ncbi:head GIN domain-containing protein [uncultured Polaribacter sp.]|uniref:head GIN domain-containing protein n=1 Tax=uncultured Polaribacter sp. TaxID=174711 RepID=UPI0030DD1311|tara:strand:+ start:1216 stop:2037 length:822 start_codon:yes stop_codon:yes gene_type:complete